jgi:hypothetical protein
LVCGVRGRELAGIDAASCAWPARPIRWAVRPAVLAEAIPNAGLKTLTGNHIEALGDPRQPSIAGSTSSTVIPTWPFAGSCGH